MSIKKSQAILKCFIYLKSIVRFTLRSENETTFCDTSNFFQIDGRPRFSKLSNLLAESLRTFLDKSGKRKEERGKRKEEKSFRCHKTWFRFLSPA